MEMMQMIKDLETCDGRRGTCKQCTYREHPACREAMAREAAAQMRLSEVRMDNAKQMLGKVLQERDKALEMVEQLIKAVDGREVLIKRIFADLDACRHCETCKHEETDGQEGNPCQACRIGEESMWEPRQRYTTIEEPKDEQAEPEELDEVRALDE